MLVLGIVAARVMATVWSSCSSLLPPGRGFSIYKTAHRLWLRILPIALEKELKSLTMLNDYIIMLSPLTISFVSAFSHFSD